MKKYYDQANQRLIFLHERPTPAFWDNLWASTDARAALERAKHERFLTRITQRFLPANRQTSILEGGCGRGELVLALHHAGFSAVGIDFAAATIRRSREIIPDLPVSIGDVRQLSFPDKHFDGYWSLGVIEHDYTGYQRTLQEMRRVIKTGGYLFITFPYLSPLRRAKARLGVYPRLTAIDMPPPSFYQFAFAHRTVEKDLERLGFTRRYARSLDGYKGLKEDLPGLRPLLQRLAQSSSSLVRLAATALNEAAAPLAGHVMLLVMQKKL